MRALFARKNGFTLIELLVVIVIIGIAFSMFLSINFSFSNPSDVIKQEAIKLQRLLELTHEQAVIRAEEYGLRLNERKYRFMRLDQLTQKWVDIDTDKLLRERKLEDNVSLELRIEDIDVILDEEDGDTEDADTEIKPQIFLLSSSELTPDFILRFRFAGYDNYYELHGKVTGEYELREIRDEI